MNYNFGFFNGNSMNMNNIYINNPYNNNINPIYGSNININNLNGSNININNLNNNINENNKNGNYINMNLIPNKTNRNNVNKINSTGNNINGNNVYQNNKSIINGFQNNINGINGFQNNLNGNNIFQNNLYGNNMLPNNLYANNILSNNLYGNNIIPNNLNRNNLLGNNLNNLTNSFHNMNLNNLNQNNIQQMNLLQNILNKNIINNLNTNNLNQNNLNQSNSNLNNRIENNLLPDLGEDVIENQRYFLYRKKNAYLIRIEKKKEIITLRSQNYETNFDEKDLSEILQKGFNSIDEAYKFLIEKFKNEKVKLLNVKKNKSIDLEINVIIKSKKEFMVIALEYNKDAKKFIKAKLKLKIKDIKQENESLKNEFNKLKKLRQRLNNILKEKNKIIEAEQNKDIKNLRNKEFHFEDSFLTKKNIKILDNLAKDSYAEDEIDNTFEIFYSYDKILSLVYSTRNKSIISYNLIIHKRMLEIKNAHDNFITSFRHYLDESNQRSLVISISGHDNRDLDSACILKSDNQLYIITSNNFEEEDEFEKSEKIKVFDFSGNKVKEIEYSNDKTFFINTYYDENLKTDYIITGNEGTVKSYNFNDNTLYHSYYSEENEEYHTSLIVKKYADNVKIMESCWDKHIRIWDFHNGTLINKISMKKSLHGICLLDDIHLCIGCGKNILILNIENKNVIREIKEINSHDYNILSIKKIYHPYYKRCLLAHGAKKSGIKLFYFEDDIKI